MKGVLIIIFSLIETSCSILLTIFVSSLLINILNIETDSSIMTDYILIFSAIFVYRTYENIKLI